jgi:hypothetical protein
MKKACAAKPLTKLISSKDKKSDYNHDDQVSASKSIQHTLTIIKENNPPAGEKKEARRRVRQGKTSKISDESLAPTRTPLAVLRDTLSNSFNIPTSFLRGNTNSKTGLDCSRSLHDIMAGMEGGSSTPSSKRSSLDSNEVVEATDVRGVMDGSVSADKPHISTCIQDLQDSPSEVSDSKSLADVSMDSVQEDGLSSPNEEQYERGRELLHKHLKSVVLRLFSTLDGANSPQEHDTRNRSKSVMKSNLLWWVGAALIACAIYAMSMMSLSTAYDLQSPATPSPAAPFQYNVMPILTALDVLPHRLHSAESIILSDRDVMAASAGRNPVVNTVTIAASSGDGAFTLAHVFVAIGAVFVVAMGCASV